MCKEKRNFNYVFFDIGNSLTCQLHFKIKVHFLFNLFHLKLQKTHVEFINLIKQNYNLTFQNFETVYQI